MDPARNLPLSCHADYQLTSWPFQWSHPSYGTSICHTSAQAAHPKPREPWGTFREHAQPMHQVARTRCGDSPQYPPGLKPPGDAFQCCSKYALTGDHEGPCLAGQFTCHLMLNLVHHISHYFLSLVFHQCSSIFILCHQCPSHNARFIPWYHGPFP